MNERMTRFYEVVSADDGLRAELDEATSAVAVEGRSEDEARRAVADAVVAFAAAHDLELTIADVLEATRESEAGDEANEGTDVDGELSEAELASVAGGYIKLVDPFASNPKAICYCFFNGANRHVVGTDVTL